MSPNEPEPIFRTRRYLLPIKNSVFDDKWIDEFAPDVKSIVADDRLALVSLCTRREWKQKKRKRRRRSKQEREGSVLEFKVTEKRVSVRRHESTDDDHEKRV